MSAFPVIVRAIGILLALVWTSAVVPARSTDESQSERTVESGEAIAFFESKIRPLLAEHCYQCHSTSAHVSESGLRLDSREAVRRGGDRGPAVVPGKPSRSLLLTAISHSDPDLQMPPRMERLPESVIADFTRWIEDGAVDPRNEPDSETAIRRVSADEFWAFQPVVLPAVPEADDEWPKTDIDRFVLQTLRQHDLQPRDDATPQTLLRRVHFDLIGLPPSPEEVDSFLARVDESGLDAALEQRVNQLLALPAFGERWGRHWLDVARFAESSGKEANISFPYAWRYRDYVIDSFNEDVPFDRFLTEQIAGDLLTFSDDAERTRLLIATGFLALGPKNLDAADIRQLEADVVDEQIDAVTRVFTASSVACARCHDHKFDPFSMQDYYALAGIFSSSKTFFGTAISPSNRNGGDPLVLPRLDSTPILHNSISGQEVESLKAERAALQRERWEKKEAFTLRDALRVLWRTGAIDGQLEKVDSAGQALPLAMGMQDAEKTADARLMLRGEVNRPGDPVPRGFPEAIAGFDPPAIRAGQSGRLELAQWLTHPRHPLTSRVAVNRIWSRLFGNGIVRSVDDFGSTGEAPSHPELLDDLAAKFIANGWSVKHLIREIVLSRTYRQASVFDDNAFQSDPENRLLWRMSKRRIEAEAIRDAMLAVSGELDLKRPVGSLVGRVIGDRPISLVGLDKRLPGDLDGAVHRSVYLPVMRDRLPDILDVFDFAEPSLVTGKRDTTNVPTQALYLMNSEFVHDRATAMAERLQKAARDDPELVRIAFRYCFGRNATGDEVHRSLSFLSGSDNENAGQHRTVSFCHALLSTVEFRVLD